MLDAADVQDLQNRFDSRYKLREDCERAMDAVTEAQHKHDVDLALINQQLAIIKWITACTLTVVIAGIVGPAIQKLLGG